jgi:hypothetical protein
MVFMDDGWRLAVVGSVGVSGIGWETEYKPIGICKLEYKVVRFGKGGVANVRDVPSRFSDLIP